MIGVAVFFASLSASMLTGMAVYAGLTGASMQAAIAAGGAAAMFSLANLFRED